VLAATNKGRLRTLAFTTLCLTMQAVPMGGLPLLLTLVRQNMGLTYSQAGSLASAYLLVYAIMQLPAGYFSDRYAARKLVTIGTLGLMSLAILLACSRQYWQLLGIQFILGFFSSLIFTPSMSIFIRWFAPRHRSTATALPLVGMNLGFLAVNLLFPVIVNRYDTWRLPFIIFGVAGIIFALGLLFWGKDTVSRGNTAKFNLHLIREVFRYKQVWLCYGLQFIRFSIFQGIGFWLPSLLLNEKQFPLQLVGIVIALQFIISAPSNLFGAYLSDRFKKPTMIIGISLVMLGITTGLMVTLNSMVMIITVILVNAIFFQFYFGPLFTLAVETLGPEKTGISNGVSNMFAIFGGLVTAYLMGFLRDSTGSFAWGFYSVCIVSAIGLILTFILAKVRHKNTVTASHSE
jgi:sugar phosphate permease